MGHRAHPPCTVAASPFPREVPSIQLYPPDAPQPHEVPSVHALAHTRAPGGALVLLGEKYSAASRSQNHSQVFG